MKILLSFLFLSIISTSLSYAFNKPPVDREEQCENAGGSYNTNTKICTME